MALQLTLTDKGITYNNAYCRIDLTFFQSKDPLVKIQTSLRYYPNRTFAVANRNEFFKEEAKMVNPADFDTYFSLEDQQAQGNDLETLIYRYLKTLSDFSGATDVLEAGQQP